MQFRILVPSATAPPSSGQPGIWRRKSSSGAVDAQGNLLVHPMVCNFCTRDKFLLMIYSHRPGWTNDSSVGVRAHPGVRVPGPAAPRSAVQQRPSTPTTTSPATTTTSSGSSRPRDLPHMAALAAHAAHTRTCRSCGARRTLHCPRTTRS